MVNVPVLRGMAHLFSSGDGYVVELTLGINSWILICSSSYKIIYRDFYGTLFKLIQGYLHNKI